MEEENVQEYRVTNFQLMVQLKEHQEKSNYRNNWVYYKFIAGAQFQITQRDFEKLAKLLGYKKEWAAYKIVEYKGDLKKMKIEKDERDREYARTHDMSRMKVNKEFA